MRRSRSTFATIEASAIASDFPSPCLMASCAQTNGRSGRPSTSTSTDFCASNPNSSLSVPAIAKGWLGRAAISNSAKQRAIAARVAPRILRVAISITVHAAQATRSFPSARSDSMRARKSSRSLALKILESLAPRTRRRQLASP